MKPINNRQIRFAWAGLGGRGFGSLECLLDMPEVDVVAVCDLYEDRCKAGSDAVLKARGHAADMYSDYREMVTRDDVDAVMVTTSWTTHLEIAIAAQRAGKYVAVEVGGASSLEECWEIVRIYEQTGVPVMMLENCCYDRNEMALLNMVQKGLFGELIHMQGGYQHDLRDEVGFGIENRHYRMNNYLNRNGEIYPTHALGPICKMLNVNRGNRMLSLVSMSSKARGMEEWVKKNKPDNHYLAGKKWAEGDIVNTLIKCAHGETILLTHDTTLPHPYSRNLRVQGTFGIYMEDRQAIAMSDPSTKEMYAEEWVPFQQYAKEKGYEHPLWMEYDKRGSNPNVKLAHGGMDYFIQRAFVEAVINGTPMPITTYDTAAWMAITCLSEQSIAMGSMPVPVPDFTNGKWINPEPPVASRYSLDCVSPELYDI